MGFVNLKRHLTANYIYLLNVTGVSTGTFDRLTEGLKQSSIF